MKRAIDCLLSIFCLIVFSPLMAFCAIAIYQVINEEGGHVDVVSGGELATAKAAGFPMDRVSFHGNNKSCYGWDNHIKSVHSLYCALNKCVENLCPFNHSEKQDKSY